MAETTDTTTQETLQQQAYTDLRQNRPSAAPTWSIGAERILIALVGFVLALGLDVAGITDSWMAARSQQRTQQFELDSRQIDSDAHAVGQIVSALQQTSLEQSRHIAQLTEENDALRYAVYRLQLQLNASQAGLPPALVPLSTPVSVAPGTTPSPTQEE